MKTIYYFRRKLEFTFKTNDPYRSNDVRDSGLGGLELLYFPTKSAVKAGLFVIIRIYLSTMPNCRDLQFQCILEYRPLRNRIISATWQVRRTAQPVLTSIYNQQLINDCRTNFYLRCWAYSPPVFFLFVA